MDIRLTQLSQYSTQLTSEVNELSGKCNLLGDQIAESNGKIEVILKNKIKYAKEVEILSAIQEISKLKIRNGLEALISYALRYVFQKDYQFKVLFDKRGNYGEAYFKIYPEGRQEAGDPIDENGGGILDIVGLALRVALMEISVPKIKGFLCLDESTKHVSSQYIENTGKFLKAIQLKVHRQILLVTHQSALMEFGDNSIDITKVKGL